MPKTQTATVKLSDSQLVILSAAAQRTDGSLLPFPQSVSVKGAALGRVVENLCKRKFAEERNVVNGAPEWRRDEDRRPFGLFITNAGLLALGVDTEETKSAQAAANMPRQRKTAASKPRRKDKKTPAASPKRRAAPSQSKQDLVIQMLRRQSGVTIASRRSHRPRLEPSATFSPLVSKAEHCVRIERSDGDQQEKASLTRRHTCSSVWRGRAEHRAGHRVARRSRPCRLEGALARLSRWRST